MKSFTLHITLYDLFFCGMIFIGLNFAVLLAFVKSINRTANRFLALALLVMILWMMRILAIDIRLETYLPGWDRLPMQFLLALGPLIYFYVLKITRPQYKFRLKDILHFAPVAFEQAALAPAIRSIQLLNSIVQLLVFVSIIIYLYLAHKLIQNFYRRLKPALMDRSMLEFRWLDRLLHATAMLWALWITFSAIDYFGYHNQLGIHVYYPFYIFFAIIIIRTAATAFLVSQTGLTIQPPVAPKQLPPAELRNKATWLKEAMKANCYYQDPDLSLTSLADKLDMTTHELSRIINTAFKKSFNDFINEYRVSEVIKRMQNPAYDHITLLGIAYDSGFNSKSTFNLIFKKITGRTPAEYKATLKKELLSYNLGRYPRPAAIISDHNTKPKWYEEKLNRNFMFKNYLKIAWRNLWLHKRMSFINITGLGIGMAAAILIAIWVQNELSYNTFQPDAGNIYRIKARINITRSEEWLWETSPYLLGDFAANELPEVTGVARLRNHYGDLTLHDGMRTISESKSAYVDEGWFKMFHYDFIAGSPNAFANNPFSLVLTESTAKKIFGKRDAIGKVLRIDTNNFQVQAIVRDNPANSTFRYNILISIASQLANPQEKDQVMQWGSYNFVTFLKLRPGTNDKTISGKLTGVISRHKDRDDKAKESFSLIKLKDIHFENDLQSSVFIHGSRTTVNVFIILAALLLVTACINYVNLTTARASLRSKEVSIRKIVGAGKWHLFRQFMFESLLVSLLAVLLAVALVQIALPWFRAFTDKDFTNPFISPVVLLILCATLLVSFLLNGIYPAAMLSSFNPLNVFRGRSMLNFKDIYLRRSLVITQFAISVILITGTLVIYRQLRFAQTMDPGYNRSEVMSFRFPFYLIPHFDESRSDDFLRSIKQRLKEQRASSNVSMADYSLVDFGNSNSGRYDWSGRPKDFNPSFAALDADADFRDLMGLTIKQGRWFNNEVSDRRNVILNETALRLINLRGDPIGQRFVQKHDTGVIVGIVKDFHYKSLHDTIGPMVIANSPGIGFYIKTRPGNTAAAVAAATKLWKEYFPDLPFEYNFLDDDYNKLYRSEQQSSVLITLFAIIAIVVSASGLFGLAAFAAEQKVKEIGIRKALGANVSHIVGLLSVDFVKMVVVASLIAFPIAWWAMNKWLQGFAYKISLSWWIFAVSGATALVIALITISYQAIKAAVTNPVKSLRSE